MRIERIRRKIWKFTDWPGLSSNVYLLDLDVPTLIDLGNAEFHGILVRGLSKLGYKTIDIKRIIFTHLHYDHVGKPDAFKNAEFFASEEEVEDIRQGRLTRFLARFGKKQPTLEDIDIKPVKDFNDLFVVRTPGHTRGSICLWLRSKRILFSGDTLFNNNIIGRTDLPYSAPGSMQDSLKKLQRFKYKVLCPGHG